MHRSGSRLGTLSSTALFASGLAGALIPRRVGATLHASPADARGATEIRAGLGGTYAALGAWAMLSRSPVATRAVGVTWLGAAAARLAGLRVDQPETDAEFWAYLAAEVALGGAAVVSSLSSRSS